MGEMANEVTVPVARGMIGAFALIYLIWNGIIFMYGGRMDLGAILPVVLLIGFAYALLDNYYYDDPTPTPWGLSRGFASLLIEPPKQLADQLLDGAQVTLQVAFTEARAANARQMLAARERYVALDSGSLSGFVGSLFTNAREYVLTVTDLITFGIRWMFIALLRDLTTFLMWIIGFIVYCQYLWGYFAVVLLVLVGPLFIPFILVDQLNFLFWGWFKAVLQSGIYLLTAAAMYAVAASILVAPLLRFSELQTPTSVDSLVGLVDWFFDFVVEWLPLVVMSLFGALKVGAVSGAIMAGATPPASGISTAVRNAESVLGSAASRFGARPSAGAPDVLSQSTARQRAYGAVLEARRRTSLPPPVEPSARIDRRPRPWSDRRRS